MYNPKVSIIIPFYNCPYVDHAIMSGLNQTYNNKEIILVNDGSDQYVEKLEPYMDQIIYIEKDNGGTASALNAGIKAASGDYISWLSSDDIHFREKTEKQIAFMTSKRIRCTCTNYHIMNHQSKIVRKYAGKSFATRDEFDKYVLKGINPIHGSSVIIQRNVFEQTGLFNEKLKYVQDFELWLKVMELETIVFLKEPLLLYRIHGRMGTRRNQEEIKKEKEMFLKEHLPAIRKRQINK